MSKSVDERVVYMHFNNKDFENGIKTSLDSIDKLNKGLQLDGAAKSLASLDKAGRSFSLDGLSTGIDKIASKFSMLGIMGITAIQNITNQALESGKQIASALTIDPVSTGYNEYELKMDAIRTIMAGSGEDLDTVNKKLEELNAYSDQTIYSFSDMTQSIGKFTNAGIDLNTSVDAIKGISNEAALSGASAEEASRAMYNLSQALSMGYVQLIDWKSIENANMGTMDFKNNLLDTAVALGQVKRVGKEGFMTLEGHTFANAAQMFKDGLQDQWLNNDVLLQTLSEYSDKNSELGKKAYEAAMRVTTFTKLFGTLKEAAQSGWAQTWEIVVGNSDESTKLLTDINIAVSGMIGASADARKQLLQGWKDAGGRDDVIEGFVNIFKELERVMAPIRGAWTELFPPATSEMLITMTKKFVEFTRSFKTSDKTISNITKVFSGLFSILSLGQKVVKVIFSAIGKFLTKLKPLGSEILDIAGSIGMFFTILNNKASQADSFLGVIEDIASGFGDFLNNFGHNIIDFFKSFSLFETADTSGVAAFSDDVQTQLSPAEKAIKWLSDLWAKVKEIWNNIKTWAKEAWQTIKDVFSGLGGVFSEIGGATKEAIDNMDGEDVATMVGGGAFITALLVIKKVIDAIRDVLANVPNIVKTVTDVLDGVRESLETWQKEIKSKIIKNIAISIGILAVAILLLASISPEDLKNGLGAVTVLFTELFGFFALFEKLMGKKGFDNIKVVSKAMQTLSVTILLLAISMKMLSNLSPEGIAKGLGAVTALMLEIFGFMKFMKSGEFGPKDAAAILIIALAVNLLSLAIIGLSLLPAKMLAKGVGAVTVLLGIIAGFIIGLNKSIEGGPKGIISAAVGVFLLGLALNTFATSVMAFGTMPWQQMYQGLTGLGLALTIAVVALKAMPKKSLNQGSALTALGAGLKMMANAIAMLGALPWQQMYQGLTGMGFGLIMMVVALNALQTGAAGGAALLLASIGILAIAVALKLLSTIPMEAMLTALTGVAGVMLILGIAAMFLSPMAVPLAIFAGAMILFGIALMAIGIGGTMAATGLIAFMASIIPLLLPLAGFVALMAPLALLSPLILLLGIALIVVAAGVTILGAALAVFGVGAMIAGPGLMLIGMGLLIIAAGATALSNVDYSKFEGLADFASALAKASIKLGFAAVGIGAAGLALIGFGEGTKSTGEGLETITKGMTDVIENLKQVPSDVKSYTKKITDAVKALIVAISDTFKRNKNLFTDAIRTFLDSGVLTINSYYIQFFMSGVYIVTGLINGMRSKFDEARAAARELGDIVRDSTNHQLIVESPSKALEETGMYSVLGLVNGLRKYTKLAVSAATDMADSVLRPVQTMSMAPATVGGLGFNSQTQMYSASSIATELQNRSQHLLEADPMNNQTDLSGTLTVQVVNDKGEIIGIATKAIKDLLRKESR